MMSAEHRRPLAAFLLVFAFACAVMANGLREQVVRVIVDSGAPRPLISAVVPDIVLGHSLRDAPPKTPATESATSDAAAPKPQTQALESTSVRPVNPATTLAATVRPAAAPVSQHTRPHRAAHAQHHATPVKHSAPKPPAHVAAPAAPVKPTPPVRPVTPPATSGGVRGPGHGPSGFVAGGGPVTSNGPGKSGSHGHHSWGQVKPGPHHGQWGHQSPPSKHGFQSSKQSKGIVRNVSTRDSRGHQVPHGNRNNHGAWGTHASWANQGSWGHKPADRGHHSLWDKRGGKDHRGFDGVRGDSRGHGHHDGRGGWGGPGRHGH
jgi:hypothetical protein